MLSLNPSSFDEHKVLIQELESFSLVEKALFGEFISKCNDDFLTQNSVWGKTSESVLSTLRGLEANGVWVILVDGKIKGFWIMEKGKGKVFFDFFIPSSLHNDDIFVYILGLFKTLDALSGKNLYININNISNISKLVNRKFRVSQSGDGRNLIRATYINVGAGFSYEGKAEEIVSFYKN